jgi:hypothetical protein
MGQQHREHNTADKPSPKLPLAASLHSPALFLNNAKGEPAPESGRVTLGPPTE